MHRQFRVRIGASRLLCPVDFEHDTPALQEDMAKNIAFIEEQARKLLARPGESAHAGRR